jgi:hypothetical protein
MARSNNQKRSAEVRGWAALIHETACAMDASSHVEMFIEILLFAQLYNFKQPEELAGRIYHYYYY